MEQIGALDFRRFIAAGGGGIAGRSGGRRNAIYLSGRQRIDIYFTD
ncbi:putative periplasmic pilin chaperone [Escherichia coli P0304816.9]|nr:putative periplasmic pilin chaperone [Escherichia coli P0298942.8]ENF75448.1 putative periplasmic pilin chaperone [Escherichia coli P0304816.9]ENH24151.1 putative periplasmic pilin chaperone [Escherichia coli P0302308.13]